MAEKIRMVALDSFESGLVVNSLMHLRRGLMNGNQPTEDINDLILKVIDAPTKKRIRWGARETR